MQITTSTQVTSLFPSLRLGCLHLSGIDNHGSDPTLESLSKQLSKDLRSQYPTVEVLNDNPKITSWKDAYRANKSKPSKYRPTVEALLRRIIKGSDIPLINNVVTAYLIAELEFLHPIGGYDLETLEGDITLKRSPGDEPFQGIGTDAEHTYEGEIIYSDEARVLTRRWNYRDCLACQITEKTHNAVLMTEIISDTVSDSEISACLTRAGSLIQQACGGSFSVEIITPE